MLGLDENEDNDTLFRKSTMPPISLPLDKSSIKPHGIGKGEREREGGNKYFILVKSEPLEDMEVDTIVHRKPVAMATRSTSQQITPSQLFTPAEVN